MSFKSAGGTDDIKNNKKSVKKNQDVTETRNKGQETRDKKQETRNKKQGPNAIGMTDIIARQFIAGIKG
ncbi:hypothetical protein [Mongoliibacter ruber]|uniref:Uncharacterized protein n=1 Tax=Mongoliibacter ruber TaxID=1750599 RepID=A0A2T0WMM9_9BACT|nr:hypothetical protein [Mongoliibacter ruber]PRY87959.1 hypothetical protein CLW00_10579 [Mongoliibacter ruber]